jgi:hypothetical protein
MGLTFHIVNRAPLVTQYVHHLRYSGRGVFQEDRTDSRRCRRFDVFLADGRVTFISVGLRPRAGRMRTVPSKPKALGHRHSFTGEAEAGMRRRSHGTYGYTSWQIAKAVTSPTRGAAVTCHPVAGPVPAKTGAS